MPVNRTRQTLHNSFWGFWERTIHLLFPFILRTIIIKVLSIDYLGLNGLFVSILQVLNMAELGFSSAITYSLYKPIAENDRPFMWAMMCLYRRIYKYIGYGIFTIGLVITPFIPYIIKGDVPDDINIYTLYWLYLANTSLSYLLFAYKQALLDASQRRDLISRTLTIVLSIQYILQIVVLLVFENYYIYYILTPVCTCIFNILLSRVTNKMYPDFQSSGTLPQSTLCDLKQKIKGVVIGKVCMTSRNAISSIILSASFGLATVGIYSNYFLITTSIASIMGIVCTSMSASVGNSMVTESEEKNHQDFRLFTFMYAWLSSIVFSCLISLYQPFMRLWVGDENMFPMPIVALFCLYFFVLTSGDIRTVYMNSKGLWWENRWRTILESSSNVILSLILLQWIGISGVIVGPVLSLIIFNFFMSTSIIYKYCFPHFSMVRYYMSYIAYFIVAASVGIMSYYVCSFTEFESKLVELITRGILSIVVSILLMLLIYHRYSYAKMSMFFLKRIFRHH